MILEERKAMGKTKMLLDDRSTTQPPMPKKILALSLALVIAPSPPSPLVTNSKAEAYADTNVISPS